MVLHGNSVGQYCMDTSGIAGAKFSNVEFAWTGNATPGVYIGTGAEEQVFERCWFDHCFRDVVIENGTYITFNDCNFSIDYDASYAMGAYIIGTAAYIIFNDCNADGGNLTSGANVMAGFYVSGSTQNIIFDKTTVFSANGTTYLDYGFAVDGYGVKNVTFRDCSALHLHLYGWYLDSKAGVLKDIVIDRATAQNMNTMFLFTGNANAAHGFQGITICNSSVGSDIANIFQNVNNTPGLYQIDYSHNVGYVAPSEIRTASGSLAAGNANAISAAWHDPEAQDILIRKVTADLTADGGTPLSVIQVGIADDAAGTNLGSEFFTGFNADTTGIIDSSLDGDTGAQSKPVLCQDNASATDGWIVFKILTQNAASLAGKYYIEYCGR
jgi:hypothetical protein